MAWGRISQSFKNNLKIEMIVSVSAVYIKVRHKLIKFNWLILTTGDIHVFRDGGK